MKALRFLIFLAALAWASSASAASMYIAEFTVAVTVTGQVQAQVAPQPATTTQKVAIGGASVSSSAFGATTHAIEVLCSVGCSVSVGTSPTATTSTMLLQQGVPYIFGVAPGAKIAVIANTDGDTGGGGGGGGDVNIAEVGGNAVTTTVPVSGTVTANAGSGTFPISGTVTVVQTTAANLNATVVGTGTFATQATLQAGSAIVGKVGIDQTTPGTTNAVAPISGQAGVAGGSGSVSATTQRVVLATDVALPAGTNAIGAVSLGAATTGGCTPLHTLSAASTNATNVKNSAGTLCSFTAINTTATVYYLKFYNTSSSPTCNSSTVVSTFPVPASTAGAGVVINLGPYGFAFSTGISFCLTGGIADNDNTSAATGVALSYSYK